MLIIFSKSFTNCFGFSNSIIKVSKLYFRQMTTCSKKKGRKKKPPTKNICFSSEPYSLLLICTKTDDQLKKTYTMDLYYEGQMSGRNQESWICDRLPE